MIPWGSPVLELNSKETGIVGCIFIFGDLDIAISCDDSLACRGGFVI